MTTTIHHGDCLDVLRQMPDNSVHAIVTDPPYGLGFMGRKWDALPPGKEWAEQCLRVLKPGGHLLAFGGTRTWHQLAVAIEDAGFEIRDFIYWHYGSGFPKSHDISKAIDKMARAEREVIGVRADFAARANKKRVGVSWADSKVSDGSFSNPDTVGQITAPATDAAKQWEGWGTALKPATEPIVMARKPFKGTVAANVLEHGTGAINVDASRIGVSEGDDVLRQRAASVVGDTSAPFGKGVAMAGQVNTSGRWPANVILDEHMARVLDEQSGVSKGPAPYVQRTEVKGEVYGLGSLNNKAGKLSAHHGDSGGASRFFYIARKDNECPSGQSSSTVSTAEMSSSGEGQAPDSAPSDAATSERHDTGKQMGSPSTNGTQNGSKPSATTDMPTTPTIESVSSPEQQHASTTPTRDPASSAGPSPQTDTTTTTTSHWTSDGSAESATSSTTQKSKELGDMDLGDSSRFMYCAKAPKKERPVVNGVAHPTTKPLSLMRWLVRLVTPPNGIVLDPFAGSGTTIEAAMLEGFDCIGIEREAEYLPLIHERIRRATEQLAAKDPEQGSFSFEETA